MAELETGLPSVRQVQGLIRDKKQVELKLLTEDLLTGTIQWQDQQALCLMTQDNQSMIIWRQAIAYIKPQA